MAHPIDIPNANRRLLGPEGSGIRDLLVHVQTGRPSSPSVVTWSQWELTVSEKQQIAETGMIWIGMGGFPCPPVIVVGLDPFHI